MEKQLQAVRLGSLDPLSLYFSSRGMEVPSLTLIENCEEFLLDFILRHLLYSLSKGFCLVAQEEEW